MSNQAVERYIPRPPERLSREELKFIVNSELVPKAYRGKPADMFACVLLGRQLGIGDMHALRSIYVVDGKASISAELMVALARQRGHSITATYAEDRVTVTGTRGDTGDEITVTWTKSMAERAGLAGKDVWKKYPEAMLWARAVSQLSRMLFPDVLAGVSYTPDEAELSPEERIDEAFGTVPVPKADVLPDDAVEGEAAELPEGIGDGDQAELFEGMTEKATVPRGSTDPDDIPFGDGA